MSDFRSITELAAALRRKELSSIELTRQALARLQSTGRGLNAVAATLAKRALAEARAADRILARRGAHSPLVGIPYGAKDNIAAVGAPLTVGSALFARRRPASDATVVMRLAGVGAVLVGKLAMIELAGAGGYRYPTASLQGATRNPWDRSRWSGGSSSGSAASVAAGLLPFTLGSETGGSMALPSAFCGVTSVRPSYGLVSRHGVVPLSWTLDKIGPMARSATDCALVLEAIAGADPADPSNSGRRFRRLRGPAVRETAQALRIGVIELPDDDIADASTLQALRRGEAEFLRLVGRRHVRVSLPPFPYDAMLTTIYFAEGASVFGREIATPRLQLVHDPLQRAGLRASLQITASDYLQAMRLRTSLQIALADLYRDVDVILSVARTRTATPIDEPRDGKPRRTRVRPTVHAGTVNLIAAGNLAGLPAVYFPCGLDGYGLPVGLQLAGPPFSEHVLLAAVETYQGETDHADHEPPTQMTIGK